MVSSGGTTRLTNEDCTDRTVHWAYDTMLWPTARRGPTQKAKTWFFILPTTPRPFHGERRQRSHCSGGRQSAGAGQAPFPRQRLSSFLLQADIGFQVIGLNNASSDLITTIKQAAEFGVAPTSGRDDS